jgi:hypothetical protein
MRLILRLLQKPSEFVANGLNGSSKYKQLQSLQGLQLKSLHQRMLNMPKRCWAALKVTGGVSTARQLKDAQNFLSIRA